MTEVRFHLRCPALMLTLTMVPDEHEDRDDPLTADGLTYLRVQQQSKACKHCQTITTASDHASEPQRDSTFDDADCDKDLTICITKRKKL